MCACTTCADWDGHAHDDAPRLRLVGRGRAHTLVAPSVGSCAGLLGLWRTTCRGRTTSPASGSYTCRANAHPIQSCRDEKCLARYLPAPPLDALVWRDRCDLLTPPASMAQALPRAHGGHWLPQELQARRAQLDKARLSLDHQLDRLTEAYLEGVIPLAEYQRRRHDLEQRRQTMDTQAQHLEARVDGQAELAMSIASIEDFCPRVCQGLARTTFAETARGRTPHRPGGGHHGGGRNSVGDPHEPQKRAHPFWS